MARFSHQEFERKQRIRKRLSRASFRLEMAELERIWAIVSAQREGLSVRDIAREVGLSPTRVHQLVTSPQADCVEPALSVLREAGWPAPEDPVPGAEEQISDRLVEEAETLISCAKWLEAIAAGEIAAVNLRPDDDRLPYFGRVDQARVVRVLRRVAHDLEELARARRVSETSFRAEEADPRLRLRRRWAEPPVEPSRRGSSILQAKKAWEDYENRLREAGLPVPSNPYRYFDRSGE